MTDASAPTPSTPNPDFAAPLGDPSGMHESVDTQPEVQLSDEQLQEQHEMEIVKKYLAKKKLKINGKEKSIDNLDELFTLAQKADGIEEKAQMTAKEKKVMNEFLAMGGDPFKFYEAWNQKFPDRKVDIMAIAQQRIKEQWEDELLQAQDPKEWELRKVKKALKEREDQEKAQRDAAEKVKQRELTTKLSNEYGQQIIKAIGEHGLPKSEQTVRYMVRHLQNSVNLGFNITMDQVAKLVKEDYKIALQHYTGSVDPAALEDLLGEESLSKLKKHQVSKIQNKTAPVGSYVSNKQRNKANRPRNAREWAKR